MAKIWASVVVMAVLALGACQSTSGPPAADESAMPQNRASEATSPINVPTNDPISTPQMAAVPHRAPIEPSFIPTSEDLIGVDAIEAESMLGAATLKRTDHGSEMWQYRSDVCVLFVFLYPDDDGAMAVSYLTAGAAAAGGSVPDDDACIAAAVRAAANAPATS